MAGKLYHHLWLVTVYIDTVSSDLPLNTQVNLNKYLDIDLFTYWDKIYGFGQKVCQLTLWCHSFSLI